MYDIETWKSKERIIYLEICRIIAVFCIMYQHTGGRGADAWMYTESTWVYMMSLAGRIISSIGVPLFWMISGALLLSKRESWEKVYKERIPRITGALIIFSAVRYFYLCIVGDRNGYMGEFFNIFIHRKSFFHTGFYMNIWEYYLFCHS